MKWESNLRGAVRMATAARQWGQRRNMSPDDPNLRQGNAVISHTRFLNQLSASQKQPFKCHKIIYYLLFTASSKWFGFVKIELIVVHDI